jgi:hypothetical protein
MDGHKFESLEVIVDNEQGLRCDHDGWEDSPSRDKRRITP